MALGLVLSAALGQLLGDSAIQRARSITADFVQKQATAHLSQGLFQQEPSPAVSALFERFFREEIASPDILRIKVWAPGARVIYSDQPELIGESFPDNEHFLRSMRGETAVSIKAPLAAENRFEKGYGQLMEVYVPISFSQGDPPVGSIEVYYILDRLNVEVAQFQQIVSLLLAGALILAGVAHLAFFRQWVAGPLGRLGAFALDVGRGNLTERVRLGRRDEIGRLAGALDGMADQLQRMYAELKEAAVTDRLTGLYNRRYFHEFYDRELARARRYGWPMAVLMIDVDRLKLVNDTYSHDLGDQVLQAVGQILEHVCRVSDIAVRWGGDEFVLILPQTGAGEAGLVADRIRAEVARRREAGLLPSEVGLSIGIGVGVGTEIPDDLVHLADVAMYREKRIAHGLSPEEEQPASAPVS